MICILGLVIQGPGRRERPGQARAHAFALCLREEGKESARHEARTLGEAAGYVGSRPGGDGHQLMCHRGCAGARIV